MFVYSVRASTVRFFAVIAVTLLALVGLLVFGGRGNAVSASSGSVDFSGIKTNEQRVAFISQFGISVDGEPCETLDFRIPESFDRVIAGYNEIQKRQGLDVSRYKNKKVTRYTYEARDYCEGGAFVNLIVYKGCVIACDISSSAPNGFVEPLVKL